MPGQNYHDSKTVHYICPFFQSEKGDIITCEGYIKNTQNKTSFQRKMNLEKHRSLYCFTHKYPACHWAELLLDKKYPSEF
ncbi:MAG: hypothetical protein IJN21_11910 [Clostridia bacterium]|nr:hypothetical protein [Clostridia bacterium]